MSGPLLRLRQLAGANWRERGIAGLGAALGIGLTGWGAALLGGQHTLLLLAAPIGASAVLVFAVPASPLAQPWPVIGGCMLSTLVGFGVASLLGHGAVAAGVSVGLAILLMSLLRCLHPPGGACALLGVLGGPAVLAHGLDAMLLAVGLDALLLVLAGLAFHRVSGHSYPHRPTAVPAHPHILPEDIDAALDVAHESFDVSRADLAALLELAERHAIARRSGKRG
jgi:CBS domain-containing membrane protein